MSIVYIYLLKTLNCLVNVIDLACSFMFRLSSHADFTSFAGLGVKETIPSSWIGILSVEGRFSLVFPSFYKFQDIINYDYVECSICTCFMNMLMLCIICFFFKQFIVHLNQTPVCLLPQHDSSELVGTQQSHLGANQNNYPELVWARWFDYSEKAFRPSIDPTVGSEPKMLCCTQRVFFFCCFFFNASC